MNLNQWFDKGISQEEYMSHLDKHRENFMTVYDGFKVPEADAALLKEKDVRIVALAEVWCGHCMMDVPVMLRFAEAGNIPVSLLPRDEHLELMDQYLTNEKRYIPVFIFIDKDGNEIGKWGPWTEEVDKVSQELKANFPKDKEDPQYKAEFKKYADTLTDLFTKDDTYWNYVYRDLKNILL